MRPPPLPLGWSSLHRAAQFFTAELRGILHFVTVRVSKHSIADLVVRTPHGACLLRTLARAAAARCH